MTSLENNCLDDVIDQISSTSYYKNYLDISEKLRRNTEIIALIDEIKKLQRQLVMNYSKDIESVYNMKVSKLNEYPIYVSFLENQSMINSDLQYVREKIQDFFDEIIVSSKKS